MAYPEWTCHSGSRGSCGDRGWGFNIECPLSSFLFHERLWLVQISLCLLDRMAESLSSEPYAAPRGGEDIVKLPTTVSEMDLQTIQY